MRIILAVFGEEKFPVLCESGYSHTGSSCLGTVFEGALALDILEA